MIERMEERWRLRCQEGDGGMPGRTPELTPGWTGEGRRCREMAGRHV